MTVEELTMYLNELIDNSPVAILVLDPTHRVRMCNPAFERLFQYGREELVQANLEDLITADDLTTEAIAIWKRVLRGEKVYASTKRRRKDGSVVDVEIHGIPLLIKGKLIGVYGIYHDVSQRKEAEMEVRQLSAQLLKLQDEERRRIARELHDCTAQRFVALNMNLARAFRANVSSRRQQQKPVTAVGERLEVKRVLTSPGLGAFAITTSVRPWLGQKCFFLAEGVHSGLLVGGRESIKSAFRHPSEYCVAEKYR
jgi:PAS domain S-box-containing protein